MTTLGCSVSGWYVRYASAKLPKLIADMSRKRLLKMLSFVCYILKNEFCGWFRLS